MPTALDVARESGLVPDGRPLLVLLSGGADSVCLLDVAMKLGAQVSALHVNHGLREEAQADEDHCSRLCERLGVPLIVERISMPGKGNLQAVAREARYALAERHSEGDYATAHTATDQAETVLYRLVTSPGRRALLGMAPRRERLVRPLLAASRDDTHAWCQEHGLPWRDDASNEDPRFARARIRHEVMPVLRGISPAAERSVVETSLLLRDEAEVLDAHVSEALARLGGPAVALAQLARLPAGLARLVLRRLAEDAAGARHPLSRDAADAVLALGRRGGTSSLDLGSGLRAIAEYGTLRFTTDAEAAQPDPVSLPIPGSVRFGEWEVEARLGDGGDAVLTAAALGPMAVVRGWRPGDRMRPLGLGGSKTVQNIFTDRKVPRSLRHTLPIVEAGGDIAWLAGVAVGERFTPARTGWSHLTRSDEGLVSLSARRVPTPPANGE